MRFHASKSSFKYFGIKMTHSVKSLLNQIAKIIRACGDASVSRILKEFLQRLQALATSGLPMKTL